MNKLVALLRGINVGGKNLPITFQIPENTSQELFVGLYPPLDFTWRLGIFFHRNAVPDSILIWSDAVKISQ